MGYYRFFLLLAVIHSHTWVRDIQGFTAVFAFYLMSGFLVTRMLNHIYRPSLNGTFLFFQNRFFRIYPTFWMCLSISALCLYLTQGKMLPNFPIIKLPHSFMEWFTNLSIMGTTSLTGRTAPLLIPGSTTLGIEVCFYVILGLFTGRSKRLSWLGFAAGCMFILYEFYQGTSFEILYFSVFGPAAVFFLGSLCYFYHERLAFLCTTKLWVPLLIANMAVYVPSMLGYQFRPLPIFFGTIYLSTFITAYCLICLYHRSLKKPPSACEQFLADISYPMFLLHTPLAGVILYFTQGKYHFGWDTFLIALIASFIASSILLLYVERPMKKIRARIRARALQNDGIAQ